MARGERVNPRQMLEGKISGLVVAEGKGIDEDVLVPHMLDWI